jgi:GH15 family glucan-1,4-alpha-glucosidase
MNSLPIGDYALLSDCRSSALVSRAGSVDWLCCPRFDAPAAFARILDADGGHFAIRPAGDCHVSRAYADQTMVLETTFRTDEGTALLTDAMALGSNDRGHDLGAKSPGVLIRRLRCTEGKLDVDVSYAPRPEYGLIYPILEAVSGGIAIRGGASRLLLSAPAGFRIDGATATARLHLTAGQTADFALQHGQLSGPPLAAWDAGEIAARLEDTMEGWRSWSALHQSMKARGASLSCTPAGCCRRSPSTRPGRSSPHPRPPCRRPSAASATGTTAIPGSATPA